MGQVPCIQKGLPGCFPVAIFAGVRPILIVFPQPKIEIRLKFFQRPVELLAKPNAMNSSFIVRCKRSQMPLVCGECVFVLE